MGYDDPMVSASSPLVLPVAETGWQRQDMPTVNQEALRCFRALSDAAGTTVHGGDDDKTVGWSAAAHVVFQRIFRRLVVELGRQGLNVRGLGEGVGLCDDGVSLASLRAPSGA